MSAKPAAGELHATLNALPLEQARGVLTTFCGSTRWVNAMLAQIPFASVAECLQQAQRIWRMLDASDYLEAFTHHPKIGADVAALERKFGASAKLSAAEQAGVAAAPASTLLELRDLNLEYERRHGFIFIVCASGKSAREMLELLRQRIDNPTAVELQRAADEQAKITALRIENWRP